MTLITSTNTLITSIWKQPFRWQCSLRHDLVVTSQELLTPWDCDITVQTCILKNKGAPRALECHSGHESVLAHVLLWGTQSKHSQVLSHPDMDSFLPPPITLSSLPCSPLFVLQVSPAVVEEDVTVFSQSSLHHSDAAVKETLKLRRVKNLLSLLFCQLPQHREWACWKEHKHRETVYQQDIWI